MEGPFADDLDRLSRALDRSASARSQLEVDLTLARAENTRLREAMSFIARKTTAALCQFGAEGKHTLLIDIQKRCDQEGFDVLGEHDGPTTPISGKEDGA